MLQDFKNLKGKLLNIKEVAFNINTRAIKTISEKSRI